MNLNNKYGYKVCYDKLRNRKIYLVTNSLDLAIWEIRWYQNKNPTDKKILQIYEVKDKKEYEKLWKGCPFKDNLS